MKIYLDSEFKCHVSNDDTMKEVETDFFDGKCAEFIENYRFIPTGEKWTREDGVVFIGEMISPIKDYIILNDIQTAVDRTQDEADETLAVLVETVQNKLDVFHAANRLNDDEYVELTALIQTVYEEN